VTRLVYWDIDGTLLTTARAGVPALEDAVEQVTGVRPDLTSWHTAGLTDRMIVRDILADLGHADTTHDAAVLATYAARLPQRLTEKRGQVLPAVLDVLTALHEQPDVHNLLLTGNVRAGAQAKLESYGLWQFFEDGGFADDGFDRVDIARSLLARTAERYGSEAALEGVIVGDTPLDVACGLTLGVRVLGVATGAFSRAQLEAAGAWQAVDVLPSAEDLLELHDRREVAQS